jgi:hypothetical protein
MAKKKPVTPPPRGDTAPWTPEQIEAHKQRYKEQEPHRRLAAMLTSMPRICAYRCCRRAKSCVGPEAACIKHHNRLVEIRIERWKKRRRRARKNPAGQIRQTPPNGEV